MAGLLRTALLPIVLCGLLGYVDMDSAHAQLFDDSSNDTNSSLYAVPEVRNVKNVAEV